MGKPIVTDGFVAPIQREIEAFARQKGLMFGEVLGSLLDYILFMFDIEGRPVKHWRYKGEDNARFHKMMEVLFSCLNEALKGKEWYDLFGDLFMAWSGDKKYRGQCFTPADLCNVMADITIRPDTNFNTAEVRAFGKRSIISDCACGSSRTLLAGHARYLKLHKRNPYLIGEDLDALCCKMSAVNMLVHGCFGEVVCHNTLTDPDGLVFGYIVNEGLYPFQPGIPTIRHIDSPEESVACSLWMMRKRREEEKKVEQTDVCEAERQKEYVQLSLF